MQGGREDPRGTPPGPEVRPGDGGRVARTAFTPGDSIVMATRVDRDRISFQNHAWWTGSRSIASRRVVTQDGDPRHGRRAGLIIVFPFTESECSQTRSEVCLRTWHRDLCGRRGFPAGRSYRLFFQGPDVEGCGARVVPISVGPTRFDLRWWGGVFGEGCAAALVTMGG